MTDFPPPLHIPEVWKRYPFRAEPPRIGHYRGYPLGQKTRSELKNMRHNEVKVIWIPDEKLFRVFDLGVAIHGSEFVCFLDTFICYWVWGKRLKVTKNFVYPGQQRRFLRNFWWQWLVASLCYRHRSTPPHARKKKDLWYPTIIGRCSRNTEVGT